MVGWEGGIGRRRFGLFSGRRLFFKKTSGGRVDVFIGVVHKRNVRLEIKTMSVRKNVSLGWIEEFVSGTKARPNRLNRQIGKCLMMKDLQQRTLLTQNASLGGVNDWLAPVNASLTRVNESLGAVNEYTGGVNESLAKRNESLAKRNESADLGNAFLLPLNASLDLVNASSSEVNAFLPLQNDFSGARHRFAAAATISRCGTGIF